MCLFVKRVSSKDNISDIPSREAFVLLCRDMLLQRFPCVQAGEPEILRMICAQQMAPRLAPGCDDSAAWEVLQERWRLGIPE